MALTNDEQLKLIDEKISDEQAKSKERINRLIDKEKDAAKLVELIGEEKTKVAQKINQLKAQKRLLEKRERSAQRKARTRRLIQHGALAEKYFSCPDIDTVEFERKLSNILRQVHIGQTMEAYFGWHNFTDDETEEIMQRLCESKFFAQLVEDIIK